MIALHAGNPTRWGSEKQYLLRSWLPGYTGTKPAPHPEIWAAISHMAPAIFPGADPCAFMGFAANGESLSANTTESVPAQRFAELGIFGTEAGPRDGAIPNPDPKAKYRGEIQPNSWTPLHDNVDVMRLLGGRKATMVDGAWKHACDDQCAVGLVNIRRHARTVFARLPAAIGPASEGSLWFVAIGFMGWSAGPGNAIGHLNRHVIALAAVPEQLRFGVLCHEVAKAGVIRDKHGAPLHHHAQPAYSCARTWQKLTAGQILSDFIGPACSSWYDTGLGADESPLREAIAQIGYAK